MILIVDWFDVVCLVLGVVSILLAILQLALNDWDFGIYFTEVEDEDK